MAVDHNHHHHDSDDTIPSKMKCHRPTKYTFAVSLNNRRYKSISIFLITLSLILSWLPHGNAFLLDGSQNSFAQFRKWYTGLNGSLEFEFKTEQPNGLVLYTDDGGTFDFFEIKLVEGAVRLRYNLGGGANIITVGRDLHDGHWHKVQTQRNDEHTTLTVDGVLQTRTSRGKEFHFGKFSTNSDVFIGGMPNCVYRSQPKEKGYESLLLHNARYFKEQDIDEFRECFYLFARSGQITSLDELTVIMRSLGLSPTIQELTSYFKQKNGKMSFADFLDVIHQHSKVENLPEEVISAFKAADTQGKGTIPAKQLRNLLQHWGEGLSVREVDNIFREANVSNNGNVRYSDFVKIACAPVPDYY